MTIVGSPDITKLEVKVTFDISGNNPLIQLENQSAGSGLANLKWWFIVKSPTGTEIHDGSQSTPDINGVFNNFQISDAWPQPFNQIEWSGPPYVATIYVQDSVGNIYSIDKGAFICRPSGNGPTAKTKFGKSNVNVVVKCDRASIWFEDATNTSYGGIKGVRVSSNLKVTYPFDDTGNIPAPFNLSNFSTAIVPISYSGEGYQFIAQSVYQYDMGNNVFVKIKYLERRSFPVLCNIDLGVLACAISGLVSDIETGKCSDVNDAQRKLNLINPKFILVTIGMQQPLTGIDVYKLIKEIEEIGGFSCDCCNVPTGIIPNNSASVDGLSFEIVPQGGDITGTVNVVGSNVQFLLGDKAYVFQMAQDSPDDISAFSISTSNSQYLKTYTLNVNGSLLAQEILEIIESDIDLVNLFNSIVNNAGGGSSQLLVDGGCIFDSTSTCNYTFSLSNIPVTSTFSIFSGLKIGQITTAYSYAFNLTNLVAFQNYLNGLGLGTFTVTNPSGQNVLITTNANPNDFQALNYRISGVSYPAGFGKVCTGYVPIDANEVVQNIINYLCNLDDLDLKTSQDYVLQYRDANNVLQSVAIPSGSTLNELLKLLVFSQNRNANSIGAGVNCVTIKDSFGVSNLPITGNDILMGTKGDGSCQQIPFLDAFRYMLEAGQTNQVIVDLFCQFVSICGAGLTCKPYNNLEVLVTPYDTACTPIIGIEFSPA